MEQTKTENVTKMKPKKSTYSTIRLNNHTQKKLTQLLTKANKKDFGKRIKGSDLIALALEMVTDEQVKKLQQSSLSNSDLLEMNYQKYVKQNGKISKDEYLGILMRQNLNE